MPFVAFFKNIRKRRAIRGYVRQLPRLLVKDYGFSQAYTPAQVRRTIERAGMSTDYGCYAISMFSDESDFVAYHNALGEGCDYAAMRAEIAASHFHGNSHFSIADMPTHDLPGYGPGDFHAGGGSHGHGGDGGHGGF